MSTLPALIQTVLEAPSRAVRLEEERTWQRKREESSPWWQVTGMPRREPQETYQELGK